MAVARRLPYMQSFGPHKNTSHSLGPTRILVRDSKASQETRNEYKELAVKGGVLPLENKTENIINRLKYCRASTLFRKGSCRIEI